MSKFDATKKDFAIYRITNGHFRPVVGGVAEAAVELGCVGSLNLTTETKTITKNCEGVPTMEITVPTKLTGNLIGHIKLAVKRHLQGLSNEGLEKNVYAYGAGSVSIPGTLTLDAYDVEGNQMLLAFPAINTTSGFSFGVTNGEETIAELDLAISALQDASGKFYYEAVVDEDLTEEIRTKWHTEFTNELVKKKTGSPQ